MALARSEASPHHGSHLGLATLSFTVPQARDDGGSEAALHGVPGEVGR